MRVTVMQRHKTTDGVLHMPGEVYECDPALASRSEARGLVLPTEPAAVKVPWWELAGRILSPLDETEPASFATERTPGALTILQATTYDPGSSAYRLHSAINQSSPNASLFVRYFDNNPHCSLRQLDGLADMALVRRAIMEADVVHTHMDFSVLELAAAQWTGQLVHHYHGSLGTTRNERALVLNERDDELHATQIGARLYHLQFSPRMHWLPIAIPCDLYAGLAAVARAARTQKAYRIAHSPTVRRLKGTDTFLAVCAHLRAKGVPVEPVLIENVSHREALMIKATCDATFDSFWLGIQGSGLEGAAMGQPVIAGDAEARGEYERALGECPYTFANDGGALSEVIVELIRNPLYHQIEAARVGAYVRDYHDYPAVAARYDAIVRTPEVQVPLKIHRPPPTTTPAPPPVTTPRKPKPRSPAKPKPETR